MNGTPVTGTVTVANEGQWDLRLIGDDAIVMTMTKTLACGETFTRSLSATTWVGNPAERWWLEARRNGVLILKTAVQLNPYN